MEGGTDRQTESLFHTSRPAAKQLPGILPPPTPPSQLAMYQMTPQDGVFNTAVVSGEQYGECRQQHTSLWGSSVDRQTAGKPPWSPKDLS